MKIKRNSKKFDLIQETILMSFEYSNYLISINFNFQ